jgi:hypothetical protein
MNRDIRSEPCSASGFLDDVRHIVVRAKVHPAEADSGRPARMIDAIDELETGWQQVNGVGCV